MNLLEAVLVFRPIEKAMSVRRFITSVALRVPPIRRFAQGKWRLAEMLQESEAARGALGGDLADARAATAIVAAERNTLRDKVYDLEAIAQYLGAARDAALDEVDQRRSAEAAHSRECADLTIQLTSARERIYILAADLEGAREHAGRMLGELKNASEHRGQLLAELKDAGDQRTRLVAELKSANEKVEQLSSIASAASIERDSAGGHLKALVSERNSLIERLADAEFKVGAFALERDAVLEHLREISHVKLDLE